MRLDEGDGGGQQQQGHPLEIVELTRDHTPSREDEAARIEAAGGRVGRLTRTLDDGNDYPYGPSRAYTADGAGGIAVSRALGDLALRPVVCGEPEYAEVARDGARDLCVLVASDGVWDVFTAQEACAVVLAGAAEQGPAAGGAGGEAAAAAGCQRLVDEALRRGSQDNASAAAILLG